MVDFYGKCRQIYTIHGASGELSNFETCCSVETNRVMKGKAVCKCSEKDGQGLVGCNNV